MKPQAGQNCRISRVKYFKKYSICRLHSTYYVQPTTFNKEKRWLLLLVLSLPKAKGNAEERKQKNKPANKSIATGRIGPSRLTECLEEATGRIKVKTIQQIKNLCRFLRGCFLFFLRNHTLFHCTYLYRSGVP